MSFHPDTLVTRQVPTNATSDTVGQSELWRSSEAKREQKRWAEQSEKALYQDAAFKRYQAGVDKALAKFESVAEWADFISFLSRLLKALQTSSSEFHAIPNKLVVAKRLSQCLNPALPSGVHTRALEVYLHIFTAIGADGLRRDLHVWSPGLLPFFPNAATSVRPLVLDVYERFYLPLHTDLQPMTRALLLSLLPGLEEESSDFFDRVVTLLNRIAASVEWPFFIQTMWLVLTTSPNVRLCAFNYLARCMPKLEGDDAPPLVALDVASLGCALSHSLRDQALLVRRQALDFLTTHIALSSHVFAQLPDKMMLFDAALDTVLRRDISLNRRLYTWLLGTDESEEAQQNYFSKHAQTYVTRMLIDAMQHKDTQRACKILVSLLDKRSIAQPLLRATVLDVFRAFQSHGHLDVEDELYPSAQMLFEALDNYVLYHALYHAVLRDAEQDRVDAIGLFRYILRVFRPHEEEAIHVHLPLIGLATAGLVERVRGQGHVELVSALLSLLHDIVGLLDLHAFTQRADADKPLCWPADQYYSDSPPDSVPTLQDVPMCTKWLSTLMETALGMKDPTTVCACIELAIDRLDAARMEMDVPALCVNLAPLDQRLFTYIAQSPSFDSVRAVLHMAVRVSTSPALDAAFSFTHESFTRVMQTLLDYMQPGTFAHHAEAMRLFWDVQSLADEDGAAVLCAALSEPDCTPAMNAVGTLWRHNGARTEMQAPLLLILDRLCSHDMLERHRSEVWLRTYAASQFDALFLMLVGLLVRVPAQRTQVHVELAGRHIVAYKYAAPFDQAYMNYYLHTIQSLLSVRDGRARIQQAVHHVKFTWPDDVEAYGVANGALMDVLKDYLDVLLRSGNDGATTSLCLGILHTLLGMSPSLEWCAGAERTLIEVLLLALDAGDATRQSMLLEALAGVCMHTHTALDDDSSAKYADLIRRGMTHTPNDTVFLAWTDLVQKILPLAKGSVHGFLLPLCHTIRDILICAAQTFATPEAGALRPDVSVHVVRVPCTAIEMEEAVHILDAALTCALYAHGIVEDKPRSEDGSTGFLTNISSVFQSESGPPSPAPHGPIVRQAMLSIQALEYVWMTALSGPKACSASTMERLSAMHTTLTLDAIIDHWWQCAARTQSPSYVHDQTIAVLEAIAPSAQIIFTSVCDTITSKSVANERKKSARVSTSVLNDAILFRFLELYASKLDAESMLQVWPIIAMLAKSVAGTTNKTLVFYALRLVTYTSTRLVNTRIFEEQRSRRDVQDLFVRLCELAISLYARTLDVTSASNRDSDAPSVASEKDDASTLDSASLSAPLSVSPAGVVQVLSSMVLPAFLTLHVDTDRVQSVATSLVYYVIAPGFRARSRTWEPEPLLFDMLEHLTHLPSTVKAWRSYVLDAFFDGRFFTQSLDLGKQWAPLIASLFSTERERLTDVIGRITTAASSHLFTSRESDLLARVGAIRRLSYVVYTGQNNAFLAQLPMIQEKVVDIIRTSPADIVHAEVYLCMRVLLCRFASQHLTGFWPIILTEMVRILGQAKSELPADKSDRLQLVFSVAKLADFLLTLQTEDFQIHQWLLVTDTPHALQPALRALADSLLDCLAKRVHESNHDVQFNEGDMLERVQHRRPMLQTSCATTIFTLQPFFATVSRAFYQSQFLGHLDWDNINMCLLRDLFEPVRIGS